MAEKVLMLALSPTMEEGTINRWLKQEGEALAQGEVLCEVETDKATMDYESVNEGTLLKILVAAGGRAKVGEPIAVVGKPGEDVGALVAEAAADSAAAQEPAAPKPAASVGPQEPAAPKPAPAAEPPASPAAAAPSEAPAGGGGKASPLARRLAAEQGLDLRSLPGSGPGGRVVKRDVERALRGAAGAGLAAARQGAAPAGAVGAAGAGGARAAGAQAEAGAGDQRIPLSGKRRIIAERLSQSKFSAPHYYLKIDVDAGPLLAARARVNAERPEGEKISFNAFLIKFAAEALKRHPRVNAGWAGDAIVRFARQDIGLAVAQEDGLITPVLRDCGAKGIAQIDRELAVLVDKARSGRLTPEEYTGASFSISSLGSAGILEFTAIINPPAAAILAVGRVHAAPVVDESGQVVVQSQLLLTLSCDHRVIDGAVGAAFLAQLKRFVENPIEALF